jgi:hypothetical protein
VADSFIEGKNEELEMGYAKVEIKHERKIECT